MDPTDRARRGPRASSHRGGQITRLLVGTRWFPDTQEARATQAVDIPETADIRAMLAIQEAPCIQAARAILAAAQATLEATDILAIPLIPEVQAILAVLHILRAQATPEVRLIREALFILATQRILAAPHTPAAPCILEAQATVAIQFRNRAGQAAGNHRTSGTALHRHQRGRRPHLVLSATVRCRRRLDHTCKSSSPAARSAHPRLGRAITLSLQL